MLFTLLYIVGTPPTLSSYNVGSGQAYAIYVTWYLGYTYAFQYLTLSSDSNFTYGAVLTRHC